MITESTIRGGTKPPSLIRKFKTYKAWVKSIPLLLILVIWYIVTQLELVRPLFLPSPEAVLRSYVSLGPSLPEATWTSLSMIFTGFLIGSAIGIALSILMAYSKGFLYAFGTIFDLLRPVPVFALIPMFVLWFGIGAAPQIGLIALGCSMIMGVTTSEAVRNIPSIYIQAAYTLGADRKAVFRTIVMPNIVPHLVGAIRLAAASSFGLDVAAEFMGSQTGLGYLMIVQQQYLNTSGIFAIVILYSVLALIVDRLIAVLESRLTAWTDRNHKNSALH
ncbi:ABC transporter permease [Cohnella sp. JJ-181]|uniref:ABC transporter permease n=1 Tax=Cohnella rhizoplanae TaxID=2974897 RepID=UPI0022FF933B|nr:ABC transporter permease [Cohnella sp. JJ-181]CAI6084902.1 Putative aliphatic sulfonates transport permease protein SsuC [Cohnella sp. JJ-181]